MPSHPSARRWLRLGLGLAVGGVALWALHRALGEYRYQDVVQGLRAVPSESLLLSFGLVVLGYLILGGYDRLASRYAGRPLGRARSHLVAFLAYAIGNNTGFANLGTSSIRLRLYAQWGYSGLEIGSILAFCGLTFWLGYLTLGGFVFLLAPPPLPPGLGLPGGSTRLAGALCLVVVGGYLAACLLRRAPIRVRDVEFASPGRLAFPQIALATLDWFVAGSALYALLPEHSNLPLPQFLGVFLLAQVAALISHVPAGLGVLESALVLLLASPDRPPAAILGTVLVYRVLYYFVPLLAALVLLAGVEAARRRDRLRRAVRSIATAVTGLAPLAIALATFFAGLILLFSGATPAAKGRIERLGQILPIAVVETSHFLGSLVGAGLLILARGLQRRLDAAFHLTAALLAAGALFSLLKGLDYEEATLLVLVLALLYACRGRFDRRARLLEPLSVSWAVAISLALGASLWLGLFAYKHVEYSNDLIWEFALHGHASRFLRASIGALGLTLLVAVAGLLSPATVRLTPAGPDDRRRAAPIVAAAADTTAHLALVGDKAFFWGDDGRGFIMFGVRGRSWVSMGDPIGPPEIWTDLAWGFREAAAHAGDRAAFYQVRPEHLELYINMGLALYKVGEEARVPLGGFTLEGHAFKDLRQARRRAEHDGLEVEMLPAEQVTTHLPRLREISDAWLLGKNVREKSFSLGAFRDDYLTLTPLALVRQGGRIVAFANLWPGGDREELSVDLMRHDAHAPGHTMDFLFIELMLHGRREGFRWFNLGMAPLSGLESRPMAPLWAKAGALLYRRGESFYNFEGLRQYKEKFNPVWSPRYLAGPGALALPGTLADIAALVGGGLKGVVAR